MRRKATIKALALVWMLVFGGAFCPASPLFSPNGIGLIVPDDVGAAKAMGGAGIAYDNGMTILRDNPALLGTFDRHTYAFGFSHNRNTTDVPAGGDPAYARTGADLFKIVVPLAGGVVLGWGITPYSRTDSSIEFDSDEFRDVLKFKGGVNMSSVGAAWSFRNVVRIGVAYNYNFGMIEEEWSRTFHDDEELYESSDLIKKKYKGSSISTGLQVNVHKKLSLAFGYTSKSDMNLTYRIRPGKFGYPESIYRETDAALPEHWRFGASSRISSRFTAALDYSMTKWEDAAVSAREKMMYTDTFRFGAGIRLDPPRAVDASWYERIPLMAGVKYGTQYFKSYPKIDTVSEKAVTFGIEFPLKENVASIIASFEYGSRGDKSKNGWNETYSVFGLQVVGTIK